MVKPIRHHWIAAMACVVTLAAGVACSHERDLDAIESLLNASGGAGGGQSNSITGGALPTGSTSSDQPWSDAILLAPGVPVLSVATGGFTHYDQHDRSLVPTPITVEGEPFVSGQQFPFGSGDGITTGSAGYFGPIQSPIASGDLLRAFFWMRCELVDPSIDQCQSAVVFEKGAKPYANGGLELPLRVGQDWTLFTQVFMALKMYDVGSAQLTFRLGYPNQMIELGAVGLEDYGTSLTLQQLQALDRGPFFEVIAADSFSSYGTAVQSQPTGAEYPFGKALNFATTGQTFDAPEGSGLQGRTNASVSADDLMLVAFWAHCVQSDAANGDCQTSVVFEEGNSPYVNAGLQTPTITVRPTWQQYYFPFRAKNSYAADEVKLGLRLGYPNQTIEFGPISLRVYDPSFTLADLPMSSPE